jgi:hypothetical protein
MAKRRKKFPKPTHPPEGYMYSPSGKLTTVKAVEVYAAMMMLGFGPHSANHYSRDPSYDWATKVKDGEGKS